MQETFLNQQTIPIDMYSGNNIPVDKYINSSHGVQVKKLFDFTCIVKKVKNQKSCTFKQQQQQQHHHPEYASAPDSVSTSTITSPPEFNQQMVSSPTLELQPSDLISALQPSRKRFND